MSIIKMISNNAIDFPEGAFCPCGERSYNDNAAKGDYRCIIVLHESHIGLCVSERERNMYDDSDFYMTVWSPHSKSAHEIMFASTRYWTYPCMGSYVDATPEVREEYEVWLRRDNRRKELSYRRYKLHQELQRAKELRVSLQQLRRLRQVEGYVAIEGLLKTKNFRSTFRESLASQVRKWLDDTNPVFKSPLSRKQLQSLSW